MSYPLASPYTPGEMATFTPGREKEQARYERLLVSVAGEQVMSGRIQVLQGPRGVGKTSLLRAVERRAAALGLTTVFTTATRTEGLSQLADRISTELATLEPVSVSERFLAAVSKVGVKVGPVGADVDLSKAPAPEGAVDNLIEIITTAARSTAKARRGLALFVDEIQEMPKADMRTLATAWQELDAAVKKKDAHQVPAVLIAAGLSNSQEVITEAATFGERFRFSSIGNLTTAAAKQAVLEPSLRFEVQWRSAAVDLVVERSTGYPYFLQVYAQETWDASTRHPGDWIEEDDAVEGIEAADPQIETFYRGRWNRATAAEKRILVAIAQGGTDEMKRADIAERLGVKTGDIGMARASLLGKGLLAAPQRGVLALNAPGFGQFILDEIEG